MSSAPRPRRVALGAGAALLSCALVTTRAGATPPPEPAGRPTEGTAKGAVLPSTAEACSAALGSGLDRLEPIAPELRLPALFELAATSCALIPAALREAATAEAGRRRAGRSAVSDAEASWRARAARLAAGSAAHLPAECRPSDPAAAASTLARVCPPGERPPDGAPGDVAGEARARPRGAARVLEDVDAGTYAFGLAVLRAFSSARVKADVASRWFEGLLLGAALSNRRASGT